MGREEAKKVVDDALAEHRIVVFSKSYCPYCTRAKRALESLVEAAKIFVLELENRPDMSDIQDELGNRTGARSVPRVFVDGQFIGGGDETAALVNNGKLRTMLESKGIV